MIAIILLESKILHKYDLVLVTCKSINLNIASRTQLILYVTLVMIFFLYYSLYNKECCALYSSLVNIDHKLLNNTNFSLTQTSLFCNTTFNTKDNTKTMTLTINFTLSTKRFDGPLLWTFIFVFYCLFPQVTIHQTTKESYPRQIQDSWGFNNYLVTRSHWIIPQWILFLMLRKSWIHLYFFCGRYFYFNRKF